MRVVREGEALPDLERSVAAVGGFDGVHVGHQRLLAEGRARADADGVALVVVLDPTAGGGPHLTGLDHRLELLAAAGVDVAWVVPGAAARPAADLLAEVGAAEALAVDPQRGDDGRPVSSALIRQLVAEGRVEDAAALLGRPHELRGVVEHGDARGRELGFPTANVAVPGDLLLPGDGVYAGWYVGPDGVARPAALNIGRRPTFYDEGATRLLEAYLLDFDGDLYGQHAAVRVTHRLRDELRFDGVEALVEQMARDVEQTRELLRG